MRREFRTTGHEHQKYEFQTATEYAIDGHGTIGSKRSVGRFRRAFQQGCSRLLLSKTRKERPNNGLAAKVESPTKETGLGQWQANQVSEPRMCPLRQKASHKRQLLPERQA